MVTHWSKWHTLCSYMNVMKAKVYSLSFLFLLYGASNAWGISPSESNNSASEGMIAVPADGVVSNLCVYVTPENTNGEIPAISELPQPVLTATAQTQAYQVDWTDFYVVKTPSGGSCRATLKFYCDREVVHQETVSENGESIPYEWPSDCSVGERYFKAHCTSGPYDDFTGWRDAYGEWPFVVYAGNDPSIDDGTVVVEFRSNSGQRTFAAEYEVRRVGSPHIVRKGRAMTGEGQMGLDLGDYEISAKALSTGWSGSRQITVEEGATFRYSLELDEAPVYTVNVTTQAYQVARPEGIDFPQADGLLCDEDDQRLPHSGILKVYGIDFWHEAEFMVIDGAYTLCGLKRGRYFLRFVSPTFYAEQVIEMPLKLFTKGTPSPKSVNLSHFKMK